MWNMKVSVDKETIENAVQRDSHRCMIADAIQQRLKWATFIQVDLQSIRFNNKKQRKRYIYLTPPEAQVALIKFDQGIKVKPFTFWLHSATANVRLMRAKHKKAKKSSREYKRNPSKRTPSYIRAFGLRGLTR